MRGGPNLTHNFKHNFFSVSNEADSTANRKINRRKAEVARATGSTRAIGHEWDHPAREVPNVLRRYLGVPMWIQAFRLELNQLGAPPMLPSESPSCGFSNAVLWVVYRGPNLQLSPCQWASITLWTLRPGTCLGGIGGCVDLLSTPHISLLHNGPSPYRSSGTSGFLQLHMAQQTARMLQGRQSSQARASGIPRTAVQLRLPVAVLTGTCFGPYRPSNHNAEDSAEACGSTSVTCWKARWPVLLRFVIDDRW